MKGRFSPGQAYVALSRGLYILNFNPSAIKKSKDVEQEMERLNTRLLPSIPILSSVINPRLFTIALLNVRSLMSKLPDIETFKQLTYFAFVKPGYHQCSSPKLKENHTVIR